MPKFRVTGVITIGIHTEVEADTPEEAIKIADGRPVQGLCYQCAKSEGANEEWRTAGELDGMPVDLSADVAEGEE